MSEKISATLLALMLLALAAFGAARLADTVRSDHDGWDIFAPVEVTTEPILIDPPDLLREDDREALDKVVREARTFGIPWSVHVLEVDPDEEERTAEEIAQARYEDNPVESDDGADDGLLMVVTVPTDDHRATDVGFATGSNFYPRGGITPERLAYIADVQMQVLIDENRIGAAVIEGATWVEWTQLFEPTPDPPRTHLERGLEKLLHPFGTIGAAALAALIAGAAAVTTILTRRGPAVNDDALDGVTAAAVTRGRVDRAVLAGAVLDAIDRGVLALRDGRIVAGPNPVAGDRDEAVRRAVDAIDTPVSPTALVRALSRDDALKPALEDRLAAAGVFSPRSPRLTVVLRAIAAGGLLLGLLLTVLSVLGEADAALAASAALAVVSLVVLLWNEWRSWATGAGRAAVRRWKERHTAPDDRERALYELTVGMETADLDAAGGSPLQPGARQLVTALNG